MYDYFIVSLNKNLNYNSLIKPRFKILIKDKNILLGYDKKNLY